MRKQATGLLICLVLTYSALAQSIKLPTEVKGDPGAFVKIPADTDGKEVRWYSPDKGLQVFPVELLKDSKTAVVTANSAGRYRLIAWTAKGDVPSDPAVCTVIIGEAPVPPDPGPNPPVPPVPPVPPTPSITEGKRCMVVYESADKSKYPEKQLAVLTSKQVHEYLRTHCDKEPDGKTASCGFFDQNDNLEGYSKSLAKLKERPRKSLPWLVIGNAKESYEGPLPSNVDDFMTLAKKYLGE